MPSLPRHGTSEEVGEELELAGFNPGPPSCVRTGGNAMGRVVGGMTGAARRDQVPVFTIRGSAIEVHRGE